LEGKDVIVHSQTGTGKTLAYLLPILSLMAKNEAKDNSVQALILVPSRELGMQILEEIRKLTEGTVFFGQQLIGGTNTRHQIERLKKNPPMVVGTPGRVAELIHGGRLKIQGLRFLVIDEVDQVLALREDLVHIYKALPRDRQTLFVSATIPKIAEEAASRWMRDFVHLQSADFKLALPESIEHTYLLCEARDKIDFLRRAIHAADTRAAIAFLNEGRQMEEVYSKLTFKGLKVAALQGESGKHDRKAAMEAFRSGEAHVLLATELGARGLDLKNLTHVFNLDLPTDPEHYLHRAGRCGRMGQPGSVVSLVTTSERFVLQKFSKALGIPFHPVELAYGKIQKITQA
ncbi:MAG TPA: DEAD/DEAH box helicase, partial [Chroococcales cyanobacterium]